MTDTQQPDTQQPGARAAGCADVLYRKLVDGGLIYDGRTGSVHHLNATAAAIWEACREGASEADLVRRLCAAYDVDDATAADQVRSTLKRLSTEGLLQ